MSPAQIDQHLDAILRAAGSGLRHYSMQKSKDDMRAALRAAIAASQAEPAWTIEQIADGCIAARIGDSSFEHLDIALQDQRSATTIAEPVEPFYAVLCKSGGEGVIFKDRADAKWTATGKRKGFVVGDPSLGVAFRDQYSDEGPTFKMIEVYPVKTYTLAEVRNGTGWPTGVRFAIVDDHETPNTSDKPACGSPASVYSAHPQIGVPGHCTLAQVFAPDGHEVMAIEPTDDPAEATRIARVCARALQQMIDLYDAMGNPRGPTRILAEAALKEAP